MLHIRHGESNNDQDQELQNEVIHEFFFPGSACAIVANKKILYAFWR